MAVRVYNTLSRQKEDFVPTVPGEVRMYVCGITSYAPSHIGHARAYVAFDVVHRWLKRSFRVTYVRNFTDVDDKIIKAAADRGEDPKSLASRYAAQFQEDMARLGCLPPEVEPKVTEHIGEIVAFIERIVARGAGYVVDGDVYFDVAKDPHYGRLSGRTIEDVEAGARVEIDARKRSPRDFALWKAAKPGEPSWPSPWGAGRPGWHIECSAMAAKYLGPVFDIHGGGKDLVFPHHENELAQSCAAHGTDQLARYWMHNGFINLAPEGCPACGAMLDEGQTVEAGQSCGAPDCGYVYTEDDLKMSKSRGNFFPVRDVMDRYEPEALRMFFLNTHYRKPIQFSVAHLQDAERRLDKSYETLAGMDEVLAPLGDEAKRAATARIELRGTRSDASASKPSKPSKPGTAEIGAEARGRIQEALDDDFNTAKVMAETAELLRVANDVLTETEKARFGRRLPSDERERLLADIREVLREAGEVLGLWQATPEAYVLRRRTIRLRARGYEPAEIEALIDARRRARIEKDFGRADELRDTLVSRGIVLKDRKDGTTAWSVEEA
ncbi:MAG: cysteine--tRNA ligase [Deltaproteobacteria bacterium]|nr:cysteine--tRNA ligase [Deltaproteobacteria bacterium]